MMAKSANKKSNKQVYPTTTSQTSASPSPPNELNQRRRRRMSWQTNISEETKTWNVKKIFIPEHLMLGITLEGMREFSRSKYWENLCPSTIRDASYPRFWPMRWHMLRRIKKLGLHAKPFPGFPVAKMLSEPGWKAHHDRKEKSIKHVLRKGKFYVLLLAHFTPPVSYMKVA